MVIENTKKPKECTGMYDIRREIDYLDKSIIQILGRRYEYVLEASDYKTSESHVLAPDRFEEMLIQRRSWAMGQGLNPDVIEKLFRGLINYFIDEEMSRWRAKQNKKV